jgi:hypothetical protein
MAESKKKKKKTTTETKYQIILDRKQMALLMYCLESKARFMMGQFGEMIDSIKTIKNENIDHETSRNIVKWMEINVKPKMGLGFNASFGVGFNDEIDFYWDLYSSIRYRISWDRAIEEGIIKEGEPRKWPEMMQVSYDEPTNYSGPIIKVEKFNESK